MRHIEKVIRWGLVAVLLLVAVLGLRYASFGQKCEPGRGGKPVCRYDVQLKEPAATLVEKHLPALVVPLTAASVVLGFLFSRSRRMS